MANIKRQITSTVINFISDVQELGILETFVNLKPVISTHVRVMGALKTLLPEPHL